MRQQLTSLTAGAIGSTSERFPAVPISLVHASAAAWSNARFLMNSKSPLSYLPLSARSPRAAVSSHLTNAGTAGSPSDGAQVANVMRTSK